MSEFVVSEAVPSDAAALAELYRTDYIACHRHLHRGKAGAASDAEWEVALGPIDFQAVISETVATKGRGSVRLLKCVETRGSRAVVGYVLYELREKGTPRKKQRYCELVNIVVHESSRGCGAGRCLFNALCKDLESTAQSRAGDIRLFVDEGNGGPLEWYKRLGFEGVARISEKVCGEEVSFLRMVRRRA